MAKTKKTSNEPTEAEFKPNSHCKCEVCGRSPTVDIYVNGKRVHQTGLCGACTWGEAACIDPENW